MRYLLDTCVVSEPTRPVPNLIVLEWMRRQEQLHLYLSVITLGELHKGVARLPDGRKRRELADWLHRSIPLRFQGRILDIDAAIAARWGELLGRAERAGRKLPVLDAMLAATALEKGATLVTRNTPDFEFAGVAVLDPWVL